MTYRQIAQLIPAEYRQEILKTNMVAAAQTIQGDPSMYYLFTIWKNYIEPDSSMDMECALCLSRIKKNFSEILPELSALEKESKLLDAV